MVGRLLGCVPCAVLAFVTSTVSAAEFHTTAGITQVFDRPLTSSLPLSVQFFTLTREDVSTTLPVRPIVEGETSATLGTVTVATPQPGEPGPAVPAVTPLSNDHTATVTSQMVAGVSGPTGSLPVKLDRSSTAAQEQQLAKFERQNRIGEAFLVACELLKENPSAEFAFDAAIRTALVLQLWQDVERFYREAIVASPLPGKYYVQLGHFYQRQGLAAPLQKLIADYLKQSAASPDYHRTVSRLHQVAEDDAQTLSAALAAPVSYPTTLLACRAAALLGTADTALSSVQKLLDADLSPSDARMLLLQNTTSGSVNPGLVIRLMQIALATETDYARGVALCDAVLDRFAERHTMRDLLRYIENQETSGSLSDAQAFFTSRMLERMNEGERAAQVLSQNAGRTPLVSTHRALLQMRAGATTEPVSILSALLQEQPTDAFVRMQLARAHAAAANATEVLSTLEPLKLDRLQAGDRSAYISMCTSATVTLSDAARLLQLWTDLAPQLSFAELMLAGDVVMQVSSARAREDYATAADAAVASPDKWPLYALLARLSAAKGDHQTELSHYQQFLAHDSLNVSMLRFVAELALQSSTLPLKLEIGESNGPALELHASSSGGTALAIELFQKLILLQPRVSDNYAGLMRAYQMRGEVEAAKKVALELADRGSSTPEACVSAGNILEENGLHADSLVFYRVAVKQAPENFDAWMHYAGALRKVGKLPEAEAIYKRILEDGLHGVPYNQPALVASLLAIAHDSNTLSGLVSYIDAMRGRDLPGKPEFYLTAAKLLMQVQRPQQAEQYLTELHATYPDTKLQSEAQLLLGHLQYSRKDLDGARSTFQAVADRYTSSPAGITAMFNVGEILRQMGKTAEAVQAWEQLARQNPTSDKALAALHEASLAAYVEMRDAPRAISLMEQFLDSGTLDLSLLRKGRESLTRMKAGQPITDYNAPQA